MGLFDPSPSLGAPGPIEPVRAPARVPGLGTFLFLWLPIYFTVLAGLLLTGAFVYYTATIPDPMALRQKTNAPVVRILARDGSVLAERGGAAPYVPIDLLPRHLID